MRSRGGQEAKRSSGKLGAFIGLLVFCTVPQAVLGAAPRTLPEVLEAHCQAREATRTLRARFVQTKVFEVLGEEDASSGVLYYLKPDAVRWQYFEPDTSWTVLRGEKGWSVFPRIRQVQKFELRGSRVDALLSIVGFGSCGRDLEEVFQITLDTSTEGSDVLTMVPKDPEVAASFERVDLTLDPQDHLPRQVVMHEVSGDTVRFEFLDLERGGRVEDKLFEYETPKGYEVVE